MIVTFQRGGPAFCQACRATWTRVGGFEPPFAEDSVVIGGWRRGELPHGWQSRLDALDREN